MDVRLTHHKAYDLRILAERISEAASAGDEKLIAQYTKEADELVSTMMTDIELDQPRFASDTPDVMTPDGREQAARGMLDQYHDLSVKYKIVESIYNRMVARLGPTHDMSQGAMQRRNEVYSEREALVWTILELMGVDS